MASPSPVPVALATHDTADRCPASLQASDSATLGMRSI
jgi:hypothetical protein